MHAALPRLANGGQANINFAGAFLSHKLKKLPRKRCLREEFVTALMSNHLLADQAHP
jgi:hypothetical protein